MSLIQPKEIKVTDQDGTEKTYIISKFPAIQGREIICKYPLSAVPKLGDYAVNEETMLKLMAFVSTPELGATTLNTRALVDNHCPDWETLARIEMAMIEYNCSFFGSAKTLASFDNFTKKVQALISKILTDSLAQSSQKGAPRSTN